MTVLLVGPTPPPSGGMALQGQQLAALLGHDGMEVIFCASNFAFPGVLAPLARVPILRTLLRAAGIWITLRTEVRKADVVHVLAASWLYFFAVVYPAVLVARASGKRVVVNYRGGEAREFFRRFGAIAAPAFKLASVVTAPSEFLASAIRQRFGVAVSVVPNVIDSSRFRYRPRTSPRPTLLVTRHLEKPYDVESILRAFRVVREQFPDASLWIAGRGSEEAHLRGLVSAWNLANVRFLGEVAHQDLPGIYDQCDICVNASRIDNFPAALLEASAAGLIVVTTGAGGIPFIYEDGRTALVVTPGDWQALASAIIRALTQPAESLARAEAAVALVRASDWNEVRPRLYETYGLARDPASPRHAHLDKAKCAAG